MTGRRTEESKTAPSNETRGNKIRTGSGSWTFFQGMAVYMLILIGFGFWPSYFGRLLVGSGPEVISVPGTPWVHHLHALIFTGWTVLLLIQASLVDRDLVERHVEIGWYGFLFAGVVIAVGVLLVMLVEYTLVTRAAKTWAEVPLNFVIGPGNGAIAFALLLGLGYTYRSSPAAHKRFMLFATIAILPAATARMEYLLGPYSMAIVHATLIAAVIGHDWGTRSQPHMATMIGTSIVVTELLLLYIGGFG